MYINAKSVSHKEGITRIFSYLLFAEVQHKTNSYLLLKSKASPLLAFIASITMWLTFTLQKEQKK